VASTAPAALDAVIARGLRKEKTERYGGARELGDAVIAAYGLSGTLEHFAKAPANEIATVIEASKAGSKKKTPEPAEAEAGAKPSDEKPAAKAGAKAGGNRPSKMKVTMVGEAAIDLSKLDLPKKAAAADAGRATVPTGGGARASSLPPLPRTGLGGKQLGMIAVGVAILIVLALLMR
jgi:hypothetical protein